jgi:hypothetical protein
VLGRRIHADCDIDVVADEARVGIGLERRTEPAEILGPVLAEEGEIPRPGRIDGGVAAGE